MDIKKISVIILFAMVFSLSLASAAVEVKLTPISSITIPEINKPAIFELSMKNLGESDDFTLYSVAGIKIEPNKSINIGAGDTEIIIITVSPTIPLKISPDYYSFEYKIKGIKAGTQEEDLALVMVNLEDAFEFSAEDLALDSNSAFVHLKSKYGGSVEDISFGVSSLFFSQTSVISLEAFEDKRIPIPVNEDKLRILLAGPYMVNGKLAVGGKEASLSTMMNFNEKEGIVTSETSSGIMIHRQVIEKKNEGNTKSGATIAIEKNFFPALFTSFTSTQDKKEFRGFDVRYTFTKELAPNETIEITATTNWWILVAIVAVLIIIWIAFDRYIRNKIVLSKRVSFVRTKGGEFALRVSITVKARDFVERIRVFDRLPPMVKLFENYGMSLPDVIDERNRRLEWNIQAMGAGEVRELSYIIYSKVSVVGRFELPAAEAIYEYLGKIKDAQSNKAFFSKQ